MTASLTATPLGVPTSLSATVDSGSGPYAPLYPGATTYPSGTTYPGIVNMGGVLIATVDAATSGLYPGSTNFPGPTDFPGRGTNLAATPL